MLRGGLKIGVLAALAIAAPAAAQVADWRTPDPANLLLLDTTKGQILIELQPEVAPRHVARIRALVRSGFYDRSQFYRVLPGFMAQAGDKGNKIFNSTLPNLKREFEFQKSAAPSYIAFGPSGPNETGFVGNIPVVVEPSGTGYAVFCPGVASMAHGDDPDTGNSQIFLMRGRAPNLDHTFAAWGRVLQGQEAVDAFKDGFPPPAPADMITRARIVSDLPAAQRPQIEVMDAHGAAFAAVHAEQVKRYGANFTPCVVPIAVKKPGEEPWPPAAPAAETPAQPSAGAPAPAGAVLPPGA